MSNKSINRLIETNRHSIYDLIGRDIEMCKRVLLLLSVARDSGTVGIRHASPAALKEARDFVARFIAELQELQKRAATGYDWG